MDALLSEASVSGIESEILASGTVPPVTIHFALDSLRNDFELDYDDLVFAGHWVPHLPQMIVRNELLRHFLELGNGLGEPDMHFHDATLNNAGQIFNHELYFLQFAPGGSTPAGSLAAQIEKQWGSLEAFQAAFEAKGVGLFGSGWVWLQADAAGELSIAQYAGADNPVAHGLKPILTFDVWEHAYYLDYQNRRAAHLHELWKIVDWGVIEERYTK